MQKVFYISYSAQGSQSAPSLNRFERVNRLNDLLGLGWEVKEFKTDDTGSFFVLVKK